MLASSLHITSEGSGGGVIDLADFYLIGLLAVGMLYLTLELRQKGTLKRLIIPISVILIASSGLAYTFGVLPALEPAPPPPGSVFVYMWPGSAQDVSVQTEGFLPQNVTVVIGVNNTVAWQNLDSVVHNAHDHNTAEFDTGTVQPKDQPNDIKWEPFERPGVFAYHCVFHPWRNGTITVRAG